MGLKLENSQLADQLDHPALRLIAARPDINSPGPIARLASTAAPPVPNSSVVETGLTDQCKMLCPETAFRPRFPQGIVAKDVDSPAEVLVLLPWICALW
jgi:hypothetical protein